MQCQSLQSHSSCPCNHWFSSVSWGSTSVATDGWGGHFHVIMILNMHQTLPDGLCNTVTWQEWRIQMGCSRCFVFAVQYQLKKIGTFDYQPGHCCNRHRGNVILALWCTLHNIRMFIYWNASFSEWGGTLFGGRITIQCSPWQEQVDNLKALVHDQDKLFPVST